MTAINRFCAALVALSLVSLGGVGFADTETNTPGSACVAADTGSLNITSDGEAENNTNASVIAVCPVDRPIGTSPTIKLSGKVFVIDQSTTANVCCKVMSKNADGTLVQGTLVCSSGASPAFQGLTLPQIIDQFTFSHYFVQCTVPPINAAGMKSRIQMYRDTQQQ